MIRTSSVQDFEPVAQGFRAGFKFGLLDFGGRGSGDLYFKGAEARTEPTQVRYLLVDGIIPLK